MKGKKSGIDKGVAGAAVLAIPFFLAGEAKANGDPNWGYLQIDVRLEGKNLNNSVYIVKDDLYYPGATDGLDPGYDTEQTLFLSNMSGAYVLIEGKKLNQEVSANSSRTGKHVKGFHNGEIPLGQEPNITVELSWLDPEPDEGRFGDMPLIATKETADGNNIENGGYRGDIRAEMDYSGPDFASIPFGKLPAGTYTPDTPFLHLRVDFEKLIANLNSTDNPSSVNLKDYVIGAKYWMQGGPCIADISGPDGVPDFIVDMYDIAKIAEQWLMRVEDGHIVAKVEKAIRPTIMSREYANSEQAQEHFYGAEKAAQLREEATSRRNVKLARTYIHNIDPGLLEKPNIENKSNLRHLLALSQNTHNPLQYETIDHKLTTNNHRVFMGSMHLSAICDRAPPAS